jgi:hypothetical protein
MSNYTENLIEALKIFKKYVIDNRYYINCSYAVMEICVDYRDVSEEDIKRLQVLGFSTIDEDKYCFQSFKYGKC